METSMANLPYPQKHAVFEQIDKLSPKSGDVLIIRLKRPLTEEAWKDSVEEALLLTEDIRAAMPDVSFVFLPTEASLELMTQKQMEEIGWHRGPRMTSKGKRFLFQGGRLTKKLS